MYSDNEGRAPMRRANDEFLRRLVGGELMGSERCELCTRPTSDKRESGPACDGSYPSEGDHAHMEACPTRIEAPSLAMVYAPMQCWRNLLDPQSALAKGSQFAELILPIETAGGGAHGGMEWGTHK